MATAVVRILMAAMAIAALVDLAMAEDFHVGEDAGWTLGVNYTQWAANKTFVPEDVIIFTYSTASHDVVEVNATDYAACSASNPIDTFKASKTFITLNGVGKRYFICGTPNHCAQGMKVEIDVVAADSRPPSASSSQPSVPAPSAAAGSSYLQAKAAMGLATVAVAAFALVM